MRIPKKFLIIGVLCITALVATIGGFAIANAANSNKEDGSTAGQLMDKVAEIYQQNTGTAIDSQELQKAFEQAQTALRSDRLDAILQKLVDEGKITQEQADQWKAWWDSRPSSAFSDEFKTWMESRPDIPGMFGAGGSGRVMPFGRGGCFGDDAPANRGLMPGWK